MALPVSLFLETRARCSRNHLSSSMTSDRLRSLRTRTRPAGCLHDRSRLAVGLVEPVEAGIGVRLHQSGIASQMLLGMLATTVARIEEHRRRWIGSGKRPVVAHVSP